MIDQGDDEDEGKDGNDEDEVVREWIQEMRYSRLQTGGIDGKKGGRKRRKESIAPLDEQKARRTDRRL